MRCIAEIADIGMTIDKKLRLTLNLQGASLVQLVQLQKDGAAGCDPEKSTPISAPRCKGLLLEAAGRACESPADQQ